MTKRLPPVEEQRRRAERKRTWAKASKAIADQAIVHRRETATLAANYVRMQGALAAAVKRIDWLRSIAGKWTPADATELEEWRELGKCSA